MDKKITIDAMIVDKTIGYIRSDTVIAKMQTTMDEYANKHNIPNSITSDFFALKSYMVRLAERLAYASEIFEFQETDELQEYDGAAFIRSEPMSRASGYLLIIRDNNTNKDYVIDMSDIVKQLATKKED